MKRPLSRPPGEYTVSGTHASVRARPPAQHRDDVTPWKSLFLLKGAIVALTLTSDVSDHAAEWRDRAACRSTDPDLFFPVGTTGPAISQIEAAKAVCRACPSLDPCLEFALSTNQDSGVWGATSEEERRKIRRHWLARRRQAAAAATA